MAEEQEDDYLDEANGEVTEEEPEEEEEDNETEDLEEGQFDSKVHLEVAKKERERLRKMAQQKKEMLERMRNQQNDTAAEGETFLDFFTMLLIISFGFYQKPVACRLPEAPNAQKSGGRRNDGDDEDAQLLQDEEEDGEQAGHRLQERNAGVSDEGLQLANHWMDNGINGILADEMALQKATTCAPGNFDVCIASFEMVIREKSHFKKFHWRYIIIDEAHRIKNENSLLSKTVRLFRTNYRLLITGTPLQNNLHELWALLNFLLPEVFHSSEKFEEWFSLGDGGKEKEAEVVQQLHKVLRPFLLRRIKSDVERSLPPKKETILKIGMTEMQRTWYAGLLQKDIGALQGSADRAKLLNVVMQLRKCCNHPYLFEGAEPGPPFFPGDHIFETSGKMVLLDKLLPKLKERQSRVLIFSQMTRMLDILEDYCLLKDHQYCRIDGNTSCDDCKGPPVLSHRRQHQWRRSQGATSSVASTATPVAAITRGHQYCRIDGNTSGGDHKVGHQYCRIDGNTSGDDRESAIDEYNSEGSEKFIFLLSTRAGGLGINLATADIVVLYDSDWNPQMDLQAMDRAHRIGQKKEVQVFRFCVENSIEEKVLEKAYKKLRLDALVIQQGRLTENSKDKVKKEDLLNMVRYGAELVNKEDLLNMVRYGAELVFSSEPLNITDADVEAIIAKGVKDTEALNEKMQQFTDNAKSFALDGGMVYDFKEEKENKDDSESVALDGGMVCVFKEEKRNKDDSKFMVDGLNLKAAMANNWIDPPKRERKRANYSESEYYRNAMGKSGGKERGPSGPRLPKMPQLQDYQFYDTERVQELFNIEHQYELHKHSMAQKESQLKSQGASEEAIAEALAPGDDDPRALTEEEASEKETKLQEGFSAWTRRDFNAFVRAIEKFGRSNLTAIASEVDGKTEEDVRSYSKVFWQRYKELNDWEKVYKNIERGEQKIQRQQDIMNAIASKLERTS
eukprot:gene28324-31441_t